MQSTKGNGYKKRFSSWYDPTLVTRNGEDYFQLIDDKAIKALRKNLLIWNSWVVFKPHFEQLSPNLSDHSVRNIQVVEALDLHRFFMSILWRASKSELADMKEFKLPSVVENDLRGVVMGETKTDCWKYPTSLIQISDIGEQHNMAPMLDEKTIPYQEGAETVSFARVYFDGLIAHINFDLPVVKTASEKTSTFLGHADNLFILGISYQASYQYENMLILAAETFGPLSWNS